MRYKLIISYIGENYSGFQKQLDKLTIQETLEKALTEVTREQISVVASGRTDAGVSAFKQVCHFDVIDEINTQRTIGYCNRLLPEDIRILGIEKVEEDFHARYSAKEKTYEYYFYRGSESPIYDKFATYIGYNVNIDDMKYACNYFLGEHDFSAFCASNTEVKTKVRKILDIKIIDVDECLFKLSITGNGFLYNMVRIIMGTLVSVGLGKILIEDISDIIKSKDRNKSGKTMPSKGLYLKNVMY